LCDVLLNRFRIETKKIANFGQFLAKNSQQRGTTSIQSLLGKIASDGRIRLRMPHEGSVCSHIFLLLPLLSFSFTTPIGAFNRGKHVISPRRSTDRILWGETSADSLEECDTLTELVRSSEFRILAMHAVSFHPFSSIPWLFLMPLSLWPPFPISLSQEIVYRLGENGEPDQGPGRRKRDMIQAGLAEYAALLSGLGEGTLTKFEPTMTVIAIVAGLIFLFWLVVFKL
jgi:hypothetical protein